MSAKRRSLFVSVCLVLAGCSTVRSGLQETSSAAGPEKAKHRIASALSTLPLYFVENQGQTNPEVGFYAAGRIPPRSSGRGG
jgi:hypothetical protein